MFKLRSPVGRKLVEHIPNRIASHGPWVGKELLRVGRKPVNESEAKT